MLPPSFDAITVEDLRAAGGLKWAAHPDAIGAFVAEMDFGTAPEITAALHDAVARGGFGYLPRSHQELMSQACAGWLRERYGWEVPAERIRPLADVIAGLTAAIEHFSTPGSPVIVPTPAYMPFLTVPDALGREQIEVPMTHVDGVWSYDLDALDAAFAAGGNLLILCNPHNPIGRVLRREEMLAVAEVVDRHGGRVFADEIHSPLVFPGATHVPYASLDARTAGHTVTAMSASKAWNLPGLKCAQLVLSNDADAARWAEVGYLPEHGAANLGVVANTAAYTAGGPWLDGILGYLDGNRHRLGELLAQQIPQLGHTSPEGTYLALFDCRELDLGEPPAEFFRREAGVAMTDGAACGDAGRGFCRYNFATPRPIMERTVGALAEALARR